MTTLTKIVRDLWAGQSTSHSLSENLGIPETSILRALAILIAENRVETARIMDRLTVYRLTTAERLDNPR